MDAAQFSQFLQAMRDMMSLQNNVGAAAHDSSSISTTIIASNFEVFNPDNENFLQYIERFENFCALKNLTDPVIQKRTFLNSIGPNLYDKCKHFLAPRTIEESSYTDIVKVLKVKLAPSVNVLVGQHRLLMRVQQPNESCSEYVAALQKLAIDCQLNCSCGLSVTDLFLRGHFIRGLRDNSIREKLLETDLDFSAVVTKTLAYETAKINANEVAQSYTSINSAQTNINLISKSRRESSKKAGSRTHSRRRNTSSKRNANYRVNFREIGIDDLCIRCGRNNHMSTDCRVAPDKLRCGSCHKQGHVSKVCISTLVKNKNHQSTSRTVSNITDYADFQSNFDQSDLNLNHMEVVDLFSTNLTTQKYEVEVFIANKAVKFEVDSGSGYTLIPINKFEQLKLNIKLQPCSLKFRTYDAGIVSPLGVIDVPVKFNNIESVEQLFIVPEGFSSLIGRTWIRRLHISLQEIDKVINQSIKNIIQDVFQVKSVDQFVKLFPKIFEQSVGKIPGVKCSLQLRSNARPVFIKARTIPFAIRDKVERELSMLEKDNIITAIDKSDWGSPIVAVPKPDGNVRLCFDYKVAVNKQLTDAHYPIPRIDEIVNNLRNSRYFCKLDLYKAYLHIEVDEVSAMVQTISTHKGTFKMNRLSFGIKSAPSEFHRILDQILNGLTGVDSYFDDIIVHGESLRECEDNLLKCFQRLQDNDLHINRSKCKFFATKISYLGYLISFKTIAKDPKKVEAILDARRPTNEKEPRFASYSVRIPVFFWSAKCEAAFIKLKHLIGSEQTLVPYDPSLPVTVACDASPVGVAAVLSHIIDGVEKPICFVSRSLSKSEMNYSQIDREALAIVFALDRLFTYLYGRKFTLITDNKPLARIFHHHSNLPPMTAARLLRYASYLSNFNYEIIHRNGDRNVNADYFSRNPVSKTSKEHSTIDDEIFQLQNNSFSYISSTNVTSQMIAQETSKDPDLTKIIKEINAGTSYLQEYTLQGNILFRDSRVYIPKIFQKTILDELHVTHPGIVRMKQLARRYCYWHNIDRDIEKVVRSCQACALNQKSPAKAPTHHWEEPQENFQRVHIDYAGPKNGNFYFILIDAKSKWPEVRAIKKAPDTSTTMSLLEDIFSFHGYPNFLVSDNATIFKNQIFDKYCKDRGITQIFIAPGHPATNGLAERFVQTLKIKLEKMENNSDHLNQILQLFRATPLSSGKSPAELYLHRQLRIRLDAIRPTKELPSTVPQNGTIRSLKTGDQVTVRVYRNNKPAWELGFITQKLGSLHYIVKLDSGYIFKRHIDQLRLVNVPAPKPTIQKTPTQQPIVQDRRTVSFSDHDVIVCHHPVSQAPSSTQAATETPTSRPQASAEAVTRTVPPHPEVHTPRRSGRQTKRPIRFQY
ncbi:uncharacterized protein K02A2.6-like [Eupeodes corollae]|uniref:uncharacterized protein K02A2.6-like n=1 Tax=Eupeodes corollae TaxID=290404 RepID=UPI0024939CDB|nr:uncharacterized protein K02A2.6-like [Eupeodes corollae]